MKTSSRRRVLRLARSMALAGSLVAAFGLAGCGAPKAQFESVDITGADYARDFALTDTTGRARTLADYRGKLVAIFFGYTQCPDVCPTTMIEMKSVMQMLGPDAARVQVLFVTLDPDRDRPAMLAQYVPAFDERFVGLYGDDAATARTAKEFKVFYQKVPGPTASSYTLDHTAGLYVFDADGHIRLFVRQGEAAAAIAHDLKLLLPA